MVFRNLLIYIKDKLRRRHDSVEGIQKVRELIVNNQVIENGDSSQ